VIEDQICYPIKKHYKIYELFQARYKLYKNIYFHRGSLAIEHMFCDVLMEANKEYNFEEAIRDPSLYMGISDYIFKEIKKNKELKKAQAILERIEKRDIYRFVSETIVPNDTTLPPEDEMKNKIAGLSGSKVLPEEIYISSGVLNYAFKDDDPVKNVLFFPKGDTTSKPKQIDISQVSLLLPSKFSEKYLRVFCSQNDKVNDAKRAFKQYCKELGISVGPVEGEISKTPYRVSAASSVIKDSQNDANFGDKTEKKIKKQIQSPTKDL
jgi:HD superfamily phosphohydrolase